jgi:hypothetical protein
MGGLDMSTNTADECCPKFDPAPWDEKEQVWENKLFVKDRVISLFHIPLNFGSVMRRNVGKIEAADAQSPSMMVLSDEKSLWGADVYIEVTKEIPGAAMATISGIFLSKAFEGPYKNMGKWIADMKAYVTAQGKDLKKMYFYYTTCPKCAKKYGKNYVVILAQV